jgi:tripartite ATP-independent transporter DctM subunit
MYEIIVLNGLVIVLCVMGMPIAVSIGIAAAFVLIFLLNFTGPVVAVSMIGQVSNYSFVAIPLFIFLSNLMTVSGITERLVYFSMGIVGHIRGGLSHVSVLTNILLAGMSGSMVADTAAVTAIFSPSMKKAGYPVGYIAAICSVGAIIGPTIPPSINFILIGCIGDISILRLFLAGVIPGLVIGLALIISGYITARVKNFPAEERVPLRETVRRFPPAIAALVIPVIILGGMRIGAFTPTEAGAVGCVYIILVSVFYFKKMTFSNFRQSLLEGSEATAKTFFLIATGGLFSFVVTVLEIGPKISELFVSFATPLAFLSMIAFGFFLIGFFLDGPPVVVIFIPLLMPACKAIGVDPIQFSVVFSIACLMGSFTPPVAAAMYMACSITGASVNEYMKEGWPCFIPIFVVEALLVVFPQLSLWLPNLVMGVAK